MIVRFATLKDLDAINALYKDYQGEELSKFDVEINKEIIASTIKTAIENKSGIIGIFNNEVIAGMAGYFQPCGFSKDIMFQSMLFFVHPQHRAHTMQFIKEVQLLLKETQATMFLIGCPVDDQEKMDRFFKIMGFKPLEIHYFWRV